MISDKKIAVALSGGVDSSTSAFLLKQAGNEVIAITAKMFDSKRVDMMIENANNVCKHLGIEHIVLDLREPFKEKIIKYFIDSYRKGYTPNPCVVCNKFIKWGQIYKYAIEDLGCDYFATGHYAKIIELDSNLLLSQPLDTKKDQLYYLFALDQDYLKNTIFPLSGLEKSQVREIAMQNSIPSKSAKESQDICFIEKPNTTKSFLTKNLEPKEGGRFVLKKNNHMFENVYHDGYFLYTIGQRKGIGISHNVPLYVLQIDEKENIVYLGEQQELQCERVYIRGINLHLKNCPSEFSAKVKIRYNMSFKEAKVVLCENRTKGVIEFSQPIMSATKGQAAVFYDRDEGFLIGGGWIE